jgi:hypothetical protein
MYATRGIINSGLYYRTPLLIMDAADNPKLSVVTHLQRFRNHI